MKYFKLKKVLGNLKNSNILKSFLALLCIIVVIIFLTCLNLKLANDRLIDTSMNRDLYISKNISKNIKANIISAMRENENLAKCWGESYKDYRVKLFFKLVNADNDVLDIGLMDANNNYVVSKNYHYKNVVSFISSQLKYKIKKTTILPVICHNNNYILPIITPVYYGNKFNGSIYKLLSVAQIFKEIVNLNTIRESTDLFAVSPNGEWIYSKIAPYLEGQNFKKVINKKKFPLAYKNYSNIIRKKEFSNYHNFIIPSTSKKTRSYGSKIISVSPVFVMNKYIMSCGVSNPTSRLTYVEKHIIYQILIFLGLLIFFILFGVKLYKTTIEKQKREITLKEKLENAQKIKAENDKTQFEVIKGLVKLIEMKDNYTGGHSERVTEYAIGVAKQIGYDKEKLNTVRYAAILHDIGKIGVPEAILNKQGKLNNEEYEQIKKHPYTGYLTLKNINILNNISEIVLQHHERIDGKGYPYGLKGEQLNEISKILCVCDSYDAMTSNRIYRNALGREKAIDELEKNSGTQFDPYIVEKFKEYLAQEEKEEKVIS